MCVLTISNVYILHGPVQMCGIHGLAYLKFSGQRKMSELGDCVVPPFFVLCSNALPSHPAWSPGLGLGLSTAVLHVLTRREHTTCCLCSQHAIYRLATHSPSLWTLITPPVWVASLRDVDAFLTPAGLWGVIGSDILNLNLACCLPVLPSLHISACLHLRKKICSEKK